MWEAIAAIAALLSAGTGAVMASKSKPDPLPTPEAPPRAPTIDDAARTQGEQDRMRRRRGRAATILTGASGAGLPNTATKTLLGQ